MSLLNLFKRKPKVQSLHVFAEFPPSEMGKLIPMPRLTLGEALAEIRSLHGIEFTPESCFGKDGYRASGTSNKFFIYEFWSDGVVSENSEIAKLIGRFTPKGRY